MRGTKLLEALRKKFRARSHQELARRLGMTSVGLNNWKNAKTITPRQIAQQMHRLCSEAIDPLAVLEKARKKLKVSSDNQLAPLLGLTSPALHHWRQGKVTSQRIANAIAGAREHAAKQAESLAIRPIVEFFPLAAVDSKQRAKKELFSVATASLLTHPYRQGLKTELKLHNGVYIFFDSRGRALYAGKAKQQSLWKEMTSAFNRGRDIQRIKRVEHPERKVQYRTSNEKSRQIKPAQLALHNLAAYVSAYQVSPGLIGELESLLVRSFANDLLNVRMERFDQQRRTRKSRKARRGKRKRKHRG